MSTIYVPGPAYLWVGTARDVPVGTPGYSSYPPYLFFGFTERGLTISRSGLFEDVNVDYAGNMPADIAFLGQEARLTGDFTRYNEYVAESCASFLPGQDGFPAGLGPNLSMGTLLSLEDAAYPLVVYCPYATKSSATPNVPFPVRFNESRLRDMTALYLFPKVYMADQYEVNLSVKRKAPRISWRAIAVFGAFNAQGVFQAGHSPYYAHSLYYEYIYEDIGSSGLNIQSLLSLVD